MIRQRNVYYVFSTGEEYGLNQGNIQIRESADLVNWELVGYRHTYRRGAAWGSSNRQADHPDRHRYSSDSRWQGCRALVGER
jgi:hypothetical protein